MQTSLSLVLKPQLKAFAACLALTLAPARGAQVEELLSPQCLVVSGQVRQGQLSLDPLFQVRAHPSPPKPGEYRLELLDSQGATLVQTTFATMEVADSPDGPERGFAFSLPITCKVRHAYRGVRIAGPGGMVLSRFTGLGGVQQAPTASAVEGKVRIQWDAKAMPTAMIRNPTTLELLAYAQGGLVELATDLKVLEVNLSDGVRSKRFLLAVTT